MGILTGFAPFLAFFVGIRHISPLAGLGAAFVVALWLVLRTHRSGRSVKVLEAGSVVLFGVLVLYTVAFAPSWSIAMVRLAVDAGLLLIILISLAIGKPFTLQYAKEQAPPHVWETPRFLRVNRIITSVWAGAIAVMVAADASAEYLSSVPMWINVFASVAALVGAALFTKFYVGAARRHDATGSQGGTQAPGES